MCGIDTSAAMLDVAARRNPGAPAATLELELGGVEKIPYPDESFDAVVTTQVLEYVRDIAGALAEMRRVLRRGGRLLVLDTDWDSLVWHAPDAELMTRVLAAWEEHLADPHLPRSLGRSLRETGFVGGPPDGAAAAQRGRSARQLQRDPSSAWSPASSSTGTASPARRWTPGWSRCGPWGEDWFFSLNRYVFLARRP